MKTLRQKNEEWLEKYPLNNNLAGVIILISLWGTFLLAIISLDKS